MDKLKELLGDDELYEKFTEKLNGKEIIVKDEDFGKNWVPKGRFNEEIEKVKTTRSEKVQLMSEVEEKDDRIQKLEQEIAKMKESTPDVKKFEEQIKVLQTDKAELEKDIESIKKDFQKKSLIRNALFKEKANPNYLEYLEGRVTVDWDEEGKQLIGLDEKLPELKKEFPVMFGETKQVGITPKPGEETTTDGEFYSLEELEGMDQETMIENMDKVNKSMAYHGKARRR